jgi:hypothetical protein
MSSSSSLRVHTHAQQKDTRHLKSRLEDDAERVSAGKENI